MERSREKYFAFLAYLLSFAGAIYVLFFRPSKEQFARYHAKQSLGLQIIALAVLLGWFVVLWILTWIPYIGFIFGIALFSLVIAAYIALVVAYISGMVYALRGKQQAAPIAGAYAIRLSSAMFSREE